MSKVPRRGPDGPGPDATTRHRQARPAEEDNVPESWQECLVALLTLPSRDDR